MKQNSNGVIGSVKRSDMRNIYYNRTSVIRSGRSHTPLESFLPALERSCAGLVTFAIGQHSGAVSRATGFQAIPRFPMATGFDDLEHFAIKVSARNLPVTVLAPEDGVLSSDTDIPVLKLRLLEGGYDKTGLRCFASGQGAINIEWLDEQIDVVNVRVNEVLKPGRTKYNCTAPSSTQDDIFYWFSFLWIKLEADGSWYLEN